MLHFQIHDVALAGDIEKAFLMVAVDEKDHDVLRFLWTSELDSDVLKPLILRYTHVVFTISSSPFLLNATINHHIKSYRDVDPYFVDKLLFSIYVDDVSFGLPDVELIFQLYQKSRSSWQRWNLN